MAAEASHVAATITTVVDPDITPESVFLVTRRELAVLTVALTVVLSVLLLLVVTSGQLAGAVFGSG